MSVHLVRHRWDLHSAIAGYDPLFEHILPSANLSVSSSNQAFFSRVLLTLPHHGLRICKYLTLGRFARIPGILSEAQQRIAWMMNPPDLIHVSAMDVLVGSVAGIRRLFPNTAIVGTIHVPPGNWLNQPQAAWQALECLDALIVLSSEHQGFFARELPATRTIFVHHGVDTNFFKPRINASDGRRSANGHRVIFAGTHMRDFDALAEVIACVLSIDDRVCFDLVIPSQLRTEAISRLRQNSPSRVVFHNNVPPAALLQLYQNAFVALLPLIDATANNSILEALACGVPVVTTNIGGTKDYLTDKCGFLVARGRTDVYVGHVMNLLRDVNTQARLSKGARARAEELSWEVIAQTMTDVYSAIHRERLAKLVGPDLHAGGSTCCDASNPW